ncbi:HlyD family type I secretion periplasmic adaptor subunit (plasmid) [Roseobacteraceae bacterium NS-SX3]
MTLAEYDPKNPAAASSGFRDLMPGVALPQTPPTRVRQLVLWMAVCGFGLFGGLAFWAATAELTSAVVAGGAFNVAGSRLAVQHLEGGIVREINVAEGDMVAEGAVVAVLDGRRIRAQQAILNSQLASMLAQQARLAAELADAPQMAVPPELAALLAADPQLQPLLDAQREIFATNRELRLGEVQIIRERISQLTGQLAGRDARLEAVERQLDLVRDEIRDLTGLFEKGLVPKGRLSQRQMQESGLLGTLGALESDRSNLQERVSEMEERILQVTRDRLARISAENQRVQEQVFDLRQRLDAAADVLERQVIRAPRAGRVVGLSINTLGQVLEPGASVLELVPADTELILETRVPTADIDEVELGGEARVQLTAYSFRTTPPVRGEVVMVAADSTVDAATGNAYYRVHIRIPEEELATLPNVKTLPGMPAQAMIETGRQTLANYLIGPVLQSMSQALKEGSS